MKLLEWYWRYRVVLLSRKTGIIYSHAYPRDNAISKWKQYRSEYYSILAFQKIDSNRKKIFH